MLSQADDVLSNATVVIVDDQVANVTLLEMLLRSAGVKHVYGVTDPREAVLRCLAVQPDLLLLDLHMPHLDGLAVMEALDGALGRDVFLPVIVLTADVTPEAKKRALAAGAKDFLTKPFDRTEVLLRVRNTLETRALYDQLQRHNARLQLEVDRQAKQARRIELERRRRRCQVRRVLQGEALHMVFQPIAELSTGQTVGAEALARFDAQPRWPPNRWFAEAAEVGLGVELELAAVRIALPALDGLPSDTYLSVNVSAITATTAMLADLLDGVRGERVVVELTEHSRVEDYPSLLGALEVLRLRGVRVAVDDAGAGYAGLQHILRLRPDIIKLDIELTRELHLDPVRRALATSLVAFCQDIDAVLIAEGIETAEELDTLRSLGVSWGQGYHIARPGPLPPPAPLTPVGRSETEAPTAQRLDPSPS